MMKKPVSIYINWSAYDELSDNKELTEEIAMTQFDHLLRLRDHGVKFDYYLMDCFWYARDTGYRTWRKPHWPNGPDAWFKKCEENGILPGLWFATNNLAQLDPVPQWEDSLDRTRKNCCFFHGGYADDFFDTLQMWADRGVRLFKFDFAVFSAAPPEVELLLHPEEIVQRNGDALRLRMGLFRQKNPDVMFLGYNGFWTGPITPYSRRSIDLRWLEVFDAMYSSDPAPSDVPSSSFWRSKDVFSDQTVRYFEANGYPLSRVDNSAFMIGTTNTCFHRGKKAWRGALILSLARGGWANTYYGNLDLLTDEDAAWFAKVQSLFLPLQEWGKTESFGPMPNTGMPYGFTLFDRENRLIVVNNPGQSFQRVRLPASADRVIFADSGFQPVLEDGFLTLGPEQLVVVASGKVAETDLGVESDIVIPQSMEKLEWQTYASESQTVSGSVIPPAGHSLRMVVRQFGRDGFPARSVSMGIPTTPQSEILKIKAFSDGMPIPVSVQYDKIIWSGLSWGIAELEPQALPNTLITFEAQTSDPATAQLTAEVFALKTNL